MSIKGPCVTPPTSMARASRARSAPGSASSSEMVRLVLAGALAAGAVAAPAGAPSQRPTPGPRPAALEEMTRAFASFDASDLSGRRWRPADLAGRVVLLDFWATWCAPCLADVPFLRQARARFPPDRFTIIGVSLDTADRSEEHTS